MKSLFLILALSFLVSGQTKKVSTEYIFPDKNAEFTVKFPEKPTITTLFGPNGKPAIQAEEVIKDGMFLRAENMKLSEAELEKIHNGTDAELSKTPLRYAENIGLNEPVVTIGTGKFGRYGKLRGFIKVTNSPVTYEVFFYFGKTEAVVLYAAAYSKDYPTPTIQKFLNSLEQK